MKPQIHSKNSAHKFGGQESDYIQIHNFFDSTKAHEASMRHRAIYHNSFGIFQAERLFGYPRTQLEAARDKYSWSEEEVQAVINLIDLARSNEVTTIINSDGNQVSIRDIGEQHVFEDLGRIPSLAECLKEMPISDLLGARTRIKSISIPVEVESVDKVIPAKLPEEFIDGGKALWEKFKKEKFEKENLD